MSYFKKGDYNRLCDECGFIYKRSELRRRYDGVLVCDKDWEEEPPYNRIYVRKPRKPFTGSVQADTNTDTVVPELFYNGDFELGDLTGFDVIVPQDCNIDTSIVNGGSYSCKLTSLFTGTTASIRTNSIIIDPRISYVVKFSVKVTSLRVSETSFSVSGYENSEKNGFSELSGVFTETISKIGDWINYSYTIGNSSFYQFSDNSQSFYLRFKWNDELGETTHVAYIDDISIKQVT